MFIGSVKTLLAITALSLTSSLKSTPASAAHYAHYGMPALPAEIEPTNAPLKLVAKELGQKGCDDRSGLGIEQYLKKGRNPKRYSAGKYTVRPTKPAIHRTLRFDDGSPAYLTVESFKRNCLAVYHYTPASSPTAATIPKAELEKIYQIAAMQKKIEALEARIEKLEQAK